MYSNNNTNDDFIDLILSLYSLKNKEVGFFGGGYLLDFLSG